MRKSSSGELESYRSRVLWSLNSGDDSMDVDQNEVTFVRTYQFFLGTDSTKTLAGGPRTAFLLLALNVARSKAVVCHTRSTSQGSLS